MQRRRTSLLLVDNHSVPIAIWRALLGVSIQQARTIPEAMTYIRSSSFDFDAMMIHDWVGGGSLQACCYAFKRASHGGGILLITRSPLAPPIAVYDEVQAYPYNWPVFLNSITQLLRDYEVAEGG